MSVPDIENLFERGFCADSPAPTFRAQVLRDSTVALFHSRRRRARWRFVAINAAAGLLIVTSFWLGRCTRRVPVMPRESGASVAGADGSVAVPAELVAWVEAADLFRRLGMEDRMARALRKAGNRLPHGTLVGHDATSGTAVTSSRDVVTEPRTPAALPVLARLLASTESYQEMMTPSLGGDDHAIETD